MANKYRKLLVRFEMNNETKESKMAKIENKYTYNVKGGRVSGVFNIYQDRRGALRMLMGNRHTELTFSQINDLMISVHDLIDFDYDEFMNYYNQKRVNQNKGE